MFSLRSLVLLAILGFWSDISLAQKYIKPYAGVNFSSRILSSDNAIRKDSLDNSDKIKLFPTGGVQFLFEKKPGREFYFGLAYNEIGFLRERLDYQFQDTVHPDLGLILDLSHAAQKNGYFTYKFKYVELPIGFNFQFTPRQNMNIYTGWFNIGLNAQYLVKQQMNIFLQGFSMKGEHHFKFENTGYDAAQFNMALQAGGRFDIKLDKKTWVTADALFKIQLLNTAVNSNEDLRAWYMSLNLGLRREIGDW